MVGRQSKFLVWINYRIRVAIQDSRILIGTFLAFDKHMNLVLCDTEEYITIKSKVQGEPDKEKKRSLGFVLLRGENIVSLSAESPPSNSKRFSEVTNPGQGKSVPIGRGVPIGMTSQAPSGLGSIGRGVGTPNMMNMMPTMGRGATPIQQGQPRMPINMPMGGMMNVGGGMIPPMMVPGMRPVNQQMNLPNQPYNQQNNQ